MITEAIRSVAGRFAKPQRAPEHTDITTLSLMRESLVRQLQAVEEFMDRLEGPEWKWFVEKYLPAETVRIAIEATAIENLDPLYERKKLIADSQIRQNNNLIEKLSEVRIQISTLRDQVLAVEARIEFLNKKRSKQNGN